MTEQDIARVAAGLTRAQREALVSWPETGRKRYPSRALLDCVEQQWACVRWGVEERWFLKPLGLAVRDHILREKSGG